VKTAKTRMCGDPLPATVGVNEWVGAVSHRFPGKRRESREDLTDFPLDCAGSRHSQERSLRKENSHISADGR
jgi:hypothetical protein